MSNKADPEESKDLQIVRGTVFGLVIGAVIWAIIFGIGYLIYEALS